jgi:membrane protease YdiL (CAAX protease family)
MPWVDLPWWKVFRRCVSIAAAVSLWLCVRRFERRSWASYGLARGREAARQLGVGLLLGLGTLGVMLLAGLLAGACRIDVTPDRLRLWRTVLGFLPAAGLVSVLEELVFRGFILQHLLMASRGFAVIASSVAYAFVHLKGAETVTLATGMELVGLTLFGIVLCLSALSTRQLSLAIGLHAAFAYGARINKLLITCPDPSRSWLVGTSRLVNGLASWAALLAVAGIIVWWARTSSRQGRCPS